MGKPGFQEEQQPPFVGLDQQSLVGQFRNIGPDGPAYEVMSVSEAGVVLIEIVYSNERLSEKLEDVLEDPISETIP